MKTAKQSIHIDQNGGTVKLCGRMGAKSMKCDSMDWSPAAQMLQTNCLTDAKTKQNHGGWRMCCSS